VLRDEVWNGFNDLEITEEPTPKPCTCNKNTPIVVPSKMSIDIGSVNLTVEKYAGDHPVQEIVICLEDKATGVILQDIAVVRQAVDASNNEATPDTVECLVFADSDTEDYTDKFLINSHKFDSDV